MYLDLRLLSFQSGEAENLKYKHTHTDSLG